MFTSPRAEAGAAADATPRSEPATEVTAPRVAELEEDGMEGVDSDVSASVPEIVAKFEAEEAARVSGASGPVAAAPEAAEEPKEPVRCPCLPMPASL